MLMTFMQSDMVQTSQKSILHFLNESQFFFHFHADPRLAIAVGKQGRTALHVAVLSEDYPIVQHIAQNFPQALRKGDNVS